MCPESKKVLIIDDDAAECARIEAYLVERGMRPFSSLNGTEGLLTAEREAPDIILLDRMLPDIDGLVLLGSIKRALPQSYIIMITAHHDMRFIIKAMQLGAYEYLPKPILLDGLGLVFDKITENQTLNKKVNYLLTEVTQDYKVDNIVGQTRAMDEIFKMIGVVSGTKATVLIQGESGTGKELIAKAIHYNGPDSDKPFVSVNCSALVETLLESELFGHEKGAFTGAVARKEGKFEYARDGTLFLDEVSEMSVNLQAKLLRVLQEKEFERVGGNERLKTDARVIAATNRNLQELAKQGGFREDLYYRLNVIGLVIPPLRERKEDLPLLAFHFLEKYNREIGKKIGQISPEAMRLLFEYEWPGNVRELENIIERAVIFAKERFISEKDLPEELRGGLAVPLPYDLRGKSLKETLEEVEKSLIVQILREAHGNQSEAAKKLGINRTTLISKLKKYHLNLQDRLEG